MPTSVSSSEFARLSALYSYGVLDTPPETALDMLVADLAQAFEAPIAQLVFADVDRLDVKATVGLPAADLARAGSLPNSLIVDHAALTVPDMLEGRADRLGGLDGVPDLRAFQGVRLETPGEEAVGALFVADRRPRAFGPDGLARLEAARDQVMLLLESRRRARLDPASRGLRREPFLEQIASMIRTSRAGGHCLSLLTVDLGGLRHGLDRAGSGLGRLALQRIGDLGREQVRQRDSLGRLADDVFAVLLSDTDQDGARVLEQRLATVLLEGWDALVPVLDLPIPITGIATWRPGDPEQPSALLDAAMRGGPAADAARHAPRVA